MATPTLTFGTLQSQIERELDLEDEDFIGSQEMIDAFNEAVRTCEDHINKLGLQDNYFLARALLSLTSGSNDVATPSNIHNRQIRKIIWAESGKIYEVKRLTKENRFLHMEDVRISGSTSADEYMYELVDTTEAAGAKIRLTPAAQETTATKMVCWFIRTANRMSAAATVFDLPDTCINYVKNFVKYRAYFKEGHPNTGMAKSDLDESTKLMVETLTTMIPDSDSSIMERDLSTYEEMN